MSGSRKMCVCVCVCVCVSVCARREREISEEKKLFRVPSTWVPLHIWTVLGLPLVLWEEKYTS